MKHCKHCGQPMIDDCPERRCLTCGTAYRGYSIEQELNGSYSIYGWGMYAQWNGFASVEAAKARIDQSWTELVSVLAIALAAAALLWLAMYLLA